MNHHNGISRTKLPQTPDPPISEPFRVWSAYAHILVLVYLSCITIYYCIDTAIFKCYIQPLRHILVPIALFPLHVVLLDQPARVSISISDITPVQKKGTYFSIFSLISDTSNIPRLRVALITSATNSACVMVLRLFMIRTIAACVSMCRSTATRSCVVLFSSFVSFS